MKKIAREEVVQNALIENYEKYYRLAYGLVRSEADALDIVQESAYKAIMKSESLRTEEFVDTWICRIVINEANAFFRKKRDLPDVSEMNLSTEDTYTDIDLARAIDSLEEKEKEVVILRYFEDKKIEEIAVIMNEKVGTVKSRLYRCMEKLRVRLEG